ncbi:hypothetical protein MTO96_020721 [Rhipicephalus appendiculatus]
MQQRLRAAACRWRHHDQLVSRPENQGQVHAAGASVRQFDGSAAARASRRGTSSVDALLSWFSGLLAARAGVDSVFLHVLASSSLLRGICFNESAAPFALRGQGTSFTGSCNVGGDVAGLLGAL